MIIQPHVFKTGKHPLYDVSSLVDVTFFQQRDGFFHLGKVLALGQVYDVPQVMGAFTRVAGLDGKESHPMVKG